MKTPTLVDKSGREVLPGAALKDFRGERWTLKEAYPHRGMSGKVIVVPADEEDGMEREFYPSVFDLEFKE